MLSRSNDQENGGGITKFKKLADLEKMIYLVLDIKFVQPLRTGALEKSGNRVLKPGLISAH